METEGLPEDEHEAASEAAEALRRWRFEQLAALGFSYAESALLADGPVDLGYMRRLIASGCPVETALRICSDAIALRRVSAPQAHHAPSSPPTSVGQVFPVTMRYAAAGASHRR